MPKSINNNDYLAEIILVKYNNPDYEKETIQSILDNTNCYYHLTVYDNYLKDRGLAEVWNSLIKKSDAEYICLLNTDVITEPNWLTNLIYPLAKNIEIGATGPITNYCGTEQGGFSKQDKDDNLYETDFLSGFCLVFPRRIWRDVGGFDEIYQLYGEDNQFCYEIRKRGYKLMVNQNVFIYHYGGATAKKAEQEGKDIKTIRQRSKEIWHERKSK